MAFTDILKKKNSTVLEFKVGEGLTPKQTQIAYEKITAPDLALEAQKNSFWGLPLPRFYYSATVTLFVL